LNVKKCSSAMAALILIALGALPATVSAPQDAKNASERALAEDDIREVVLRKEMLEWAQGGDKDEAEAKSESDKAVAQHLNFKVFFVAVDGKDPDDQFLKRFANIPRIIKKQSESEINKKTRLAVVDKKTHQFGIIFYADKVHWENDSSVEIDGGYHCDGLCGAGITYVVSRENGKWVVKSERMNWIS